MGGLYQKETEVQLTNQLHPGSDMEVIFRTCFMIESLEIKSWQTSMQKI